MAKQDINYGTTAGDGTGESLFAAFKKAKENFTELYGAKTEFVANAAALPATGETGKIYIALDTSAIYRWTGSAYTDLLIARWNPTRTGLVDPANGAAFLRGPLVNGEWTTVPSIFRLRLTGTGTVSLDSKDSLGNITTGVASYTPSGATDQIEFPYAGDNAVAIRATLTGTATAEVI